MVITRLLYKVVIIMVCEWRVNLDSYAYSRPINFAMEQWGMVGIHIRMYNIIIFGIIQRSDHMTAVQYYLELQYDLG